MHLWQKTSSNTTKNKKENYFFRCRCINSNKTTCTPATITCKALETRSQWWVAWAEWCQGSSSSSNSSSKWWIWAAVWVKVWEEAWEQALEEVWTKWAEEDKVLLEECRDKMMVFSIDSSSSSSRTKCRCRGIRINMAVVVEVTMRWICRLIRMPWVVVEPEEARVALMTSRMIWDKFRPVRVEDRWTTLINQWWNSVTQIQTTWCQTKTNIWVDNSNSSSSSSNSSREMIWVTICFRTKISTRCSEVKVRVTCTEWTKFRWDMGINSRTCIGSSNSSKWCRPNHQVQMMR